MEFIYTDKVADDQEKITASIKKAKEAGAEILFVTGGMSVDPDDRTPAAISESGAKIVTYGSPVFPGAMMLLGYFDDCVPIMGLPSCVMYEKASAFDVVIPRILAGEALVKEDIAILGHGDLCLQCDT